MAGRACENRAVSSPRRPLIGITTYVEEAKWGVWDTRAALVPYGYVRHVESAGGTVVLVPPNASHAAEALAALDGLLLAGGADLDPALYGAEPHERTLGDTRGSRRRRIGGVASGPVP